MPKVSIIFAMVLIVFVGYFVGTAIFLSIIHYLNIEYSVYLHGFFAIISIFVAIKNRAEIIQQFSKKRKEEKTK